MKIKLNNKEVKNPIARIAVAIFVVVSVGVIFFLTGAFLLVLLPFILLMIIAAVVLSIFIR